MSKTYTVKDIADILGYSTNSIYTFLKEGRIKGVRVGRGRFRIPQAEVDWLLLGRGANSAAVSQPLETPSPTTETLREIPQALLQAGWINGVREPAGLRLLTHFKEATVGKHPSIPSFFDWLLGILSLVLGLGLSLFTGFFDDISLSAYLPWKVVLQTIFMAAGLGLLLTDMRWIKKSLWHFIFHGLLVVAWMVLAVLAGLGQDFDSAALFGTVGLTAVVTGLWGLGDLSGFTLLIILIVVVTGPAALVFWPTDPHLAWWQLLPLPGANFMIAAGSVVWGVLLGVSFRWSRRLFFLLLAAATVVLASLVFWFAASGFWLRAFLLLVLAVFCLFANVWEALIASSHPHRRLIFGFFGAILALFLLSVGSAWMFQVNMYDYASRQMRDKLEYARLLVEDAVERSRLTLEGAGKNPLVREHFTAGEADKKVLTELARNLFDANPYFYRILFVAPNGDILALYPLSDPFTVSNIGFRDYFLRTVERKETTVSEVFEAATESRSKRVAITVPVVGTKGEPLGVLVGGLAIESIGIKLQEIAGEEWDESFFLLDSSGRFIVHPQVSMVGTEAKQGEFGMRGSPAPLLTEGYGTDGKRVIQASLTIPLTGWVVIVEAPLTKLLYSTRAATVTVIGVLGISLLLMLGLSFAAAARYLPSRAPRGRPRAVKP